MEHLICISRQYASGGHEIGRRLAEKLGIPCYDRELLQKSAKDANVKGAVFESNDEKVTNSLLYNIASGNLMALANIARPFIAPMADKIFAYEADTIRKLAEQGPGVFIGRCAGELLKEDKRCIRVFIYADEEFRRERAVKYYGCDPGKVGEILEKKDRERATYHNYYMNTKWGNVSNCDLSINSARVDIDGAVKVILSGLEAMDQKV